MKNFENFRLNNYGKRFIFMLISAIVLLILFGIESLRGQTTSKDCKDTSGFIQETFPKVYEAIVSEATVNYPNNYFDRQYDIKMQCAAFGAFMIILTEDDPALPKKELLDISLRSLARSSKNFKNNSPCDTIPGTLKSLDCILSGMIVNWPDALNEMTGRVWIYKSSHANL